MYMSIVILNNHMEYNEYLLQCNGIHTGTLFVFGQISKYFKHKTLHIPNHMIKYFNFINTPFEQINQRLN